MLADESLALAEKAKLAGVDTEYALYDGVTHGFLRPPPRSPGRSAALADGALWLKRILA